MRSVTSLTMDYKDLNKLIGLIRSETLQKKKILPGGMFQKSKDFESSYLQLAKQYYQENVASHAVAGFVNDKNHDEISAYLREQEIDFRDAAITIDPETQQCKSIQFSTSKLDPLLRHFLNDACRMLEALTEPLSTVLDVSAANKERSKESISFNNYLKRVGKAKVKTGLNDDYFIAMYDEFWNDYKHSGSDSLTATNWYITRDRVNVPQLYSPGIRHFQGHTVESFLENVTKNIHMLVTKL